MDNNLKDFPVASEVQVILEGNVGYVVDGGFVTAHWEPDQNHPPRITIESTSKMNRGKQITFAFIQKLSGESGWVLLPEKSHDEQFTIDQNSTLHNLNRIYPVD